MFTSAGFIIESVKLLNDDDDTTEIVLTTNEIIGIAVGVSVTLGLVVVIFVGLIW